MYTECMKKLPKSLTKVTGFSKLLAFTLIVIFLFCAFFVGMLYEKQIGDMHSTVVTPALYQLSK